MSTPVFFPSVSSVKTALPLDNYVSFLNSFGALNKQFLVSAYDLAVEHEAGDGPFSSAVRDATSVLLLDSGNYESYWKGAGASWTQSKFHEVIRRTSASIVFGFDIQDPPTDPAKHMKMVIEHWERDQRVCGEIPVVPIVHASPEDLPALCQAVLKHTRASMIAVAERRLGDGILERATTIGLIRARLDELGSTVGLHILGTGNPISIAIFTMSGADSFDGLEWCNVVVDRRSAMLSHFSHADFFRGQSEIGDDVEFPARTLAHNLDFYVDWMRQIRLAARKNELVSFCEQCLPTDVFEMCRAALNW